MKKIILFVSGVFILVGCGNTNSNGNNQPTISSLEKTVSSLKEENTKLKKKAELLDIFLNDSGSTSENSSSSNNGNTFSLNKALEFKSGEIVTVQSVEDDPDLKLNEVTEGEHPVVVTAIIENASSSPLSINPHSFSLYDGNSEIARLDASTYLNNIPNDIAAGMKTTLIMHFSAKGDSPYSVSFGDALWKQ